MKMKIKKFNLIFNNKNFKFNSKKYNKKYKKV